MQKGRGGLAHGNCECTMLEKMWLENKVKNRVIL